MFRVQALPKHDLYRRIGHIAVAYKHYIIIWGGFKSAITSNVYCSPNVVWMYNCVSEVWTEADTAGDMPAIASGCTGLVLDNYLYIFGGCEECLPTHVFRYRNRIVRLNLIDFKWQALQPKGEEPLCCDKGVGWVYNDKLYVFGGYGDGPGQGNVNRRYLFLGDTIISQKGWNNMLLCYNPLSNEWTDVITSGPAPSPRAAHSCDILGSKVFIFGGRLFDERLDDLHILDMDSLSWSGNVLSHHDGPRPCGMSWHSFTAVNDDTAILYGGLNTSGIPNALWWTLKVDGDNFTWTSRDLPQSLVWHSAVYSNDTKEIIIIGGVSSSPYLIEATDHCEHQIIIQFSPRSLFRECLLKIVEISVSNKELFTMWQDFIKSMPAVLQDVVQKRISQGPEYKLILSI